MKPASRSTSAADSAPAGPPPTRRPRIPALASSWDAITSLKLTIACLVALMVLVIGCTLAQVHLGTWGAVQHYMRSWLVWWDIPHTVLSVPVFPGGALTGLVLILNLVTAQLRRLELSWRKSGLWIVHLGLIVLVAGEFVSAVFQRDNELTLTNGETGNYVASPTVAELAVIDRSGGTYDEVWSFPQSMLRPGAVVQVPGRPVALRVLSYFDNSQVANAPDGQGVSSAGLGRNHSVVGIPRTGREDERNIPGAIVERIGAQAGGGPETWAVSAWVTDHQTFEADGRTYDLVMRFRREYLPYAVTLKKFSHDVYPGTDIPKNFSSLVHVANPRTGEARDVLIKMNQPLRYGGKTFYQASYRGEDTTVLQVVENPGWLLPYASCLLVAIGLLVHFGISLARWVRAQSAPVAAGSSEVSV